MRIVSHFFDLLFPPRPSELLVRNTARLPICENIHQQTTSLAEFSHPAVHAAITENKFFRNRRAARLLANILNDWIQKQTGPVLFIPIPLSKQRQKERGYNQVTEVLRACQAIEISETILVRNKETKPQTSLNKTERKQNLVDAFIVRNKTVLSEYEKYTFVIVDDVVTTGATMRAARSEVEKHLPNANQIVCITLAH